MSYERVRGSRFTITREIFQLKTFSKKPPALIKTQKAKQKKPCLERSRFIPNEPPLRCTGRGGEGGQRACARERAYSSEWARLVNQRVGGMNEIVNIIDRRAGVGRPVERSASRIKPAETGGTARCKTGTAICMRRDAAPRGRRIEVITSPPLQDKRYTFCLLRPIIGSARPPDCD